MNKEKYSICLFGASLTTGNMGVSALSVSLINLLNRVKPDSKITLVIPQRESGKHELFINNKKKIINIVNFRLSPKSRLSDHLFWIFILALCSKVIPFNSIRLSIINSNNMLKQLYSADFIGDIYSGDSFSDIYGFFRFVISIIPRLIIILLNKKYVLLPQTYGPYKNILSEHLASNILLKANKIFSRDKQGIILVKKMLRKKRIIKNIYYCPDVAFTLEPIKPENYNLPINNNNKKPIIGINISGLLYNGGYTKNNMFQLKITYKDFVKELIRKILASGKHYIFLVPHTYSNDDGIENDYYACSLAWKSLSVQEKEKVFVIPKDFNQNEIKWIIGNCDFFIGSRMHSCIAALSQGIPTIGLAYSKKFKGVFSSVDSDDMVIDARTTESVPAFKRILIALEERKDKAEKLIINIKKVKNDIMNYFSDLL